jgi:hypothetical protein
MGPAAVRQAVVRVEGQLVAVVVAQTGTALPQMVET